MKYENIFKELKQNSIIQNFIIQSFYLPMTLN